MYIAQTDNRQFCVFHRLSQAKDKFSVNRVIRSPRLVNEFLSP